MDNGPLSSIAAGAWDATNGTVWNDARCALSRTATGDVKVLLQIPTAEGNFAAAITQNGAPARAYFGIVHVSDTEKHIQSIGVESPIDASFSFVFYRGSET